MNKIMNFIRNMFSTENQVDILKNGFNHLIASHKQAQLKIINAKKTFEKIREITLKDFEDTKKSTLKNTQDAIEKLHLKTYQEEKEIEDKYYIAKSKLRDKVRLVNELQQEYIRVGGMEFPIE